MPCFISRDNGRLNSPKCAIKKSFGDIHVIEQFKNFLCCLLFLFWYFIITYSHLKNIIYMFSFKPTNKLFQVPSYVEFCLIKSLEMFRVFMLFLTLQSIYYRFVLSVSIADSSIWINNLKKYKMLEYILKIKKAYRLVNKERY